MNTRMWALPYEEELHTQLLHTAGPGCVPLCIYSAMTANSRGAVIPTKRSSFSEEIKLRAGWYRTIINKDDTLSHLLIILPKTCTLRGFATGGTFFS